MSVNWSKILYKTHNTTTKKTYNKKNKKVWYILNYIRYERSKYGFRSESVFALEQYYNFVRGGGTDINANGVVYFFMSFFFIYFYLNLERLF